MVDEQVYSRSATLSKACEKQKHGAKDILPRRLVIAHKQTWPMAADRYQTLHCSTHCAQNNVTQCAHQHEDGVLRPQVLLKGHHDL